jgi:hypothetical protein
MLLLCLHEVVQHRYSSYPDRLDEEWVVQFCQRPRLVNRSDDHRSVALLTRRNRVVSFPHRSKNAAPTPAEEEQEELCIASEIIGSTENIFTTYLSSPKVFYTSNLLAVDSENDVAKQRCKDLPYVWVLRIPFLPVIHQRYRWLVHNRFRHLLLVMIDVDMLLHPTLIRLYHVRNRSAN